LTVFLFFSEGIVNLPLSLWQIMNRVWSYQCKTSKYKKLLCQIIFEMSCCFASLEHLSYIFSFSSFIFLSFSPTFYNGSFISVSTDFSFTFIPLNFSIT
jgi:hypothetical protein